MICLDTTVLIDLLRKEQSPNRRAAEEKVKQYWQDGNLLCTTRINVAEVLVGAARSRDPATQRQRIDRLLQPMEILEVDDKSTERFAKIKASALSKGKPLGDADLLIAAIAISNGCKIVTRNTRHFIAVAGLEIETY